VSRFCILKGFFRFDFPFVLFSKPICTAGLALFLMVFTQPVYAFQVMLTWDPNTETNLGGYRVFCREEGQSYNYDLPAWEGIDSTCTIYNLHDSAKYYFVARAFNLTGEESGDSNEVCITPSGNVAPVSDAGPDQTALEGETVILNGANSHDPDGTIVSYNWAQTSGTPVALSDVRSASPDFTAPADSQEGEALVFRLTVTDDGGLQSADSCIVNISRTNLPPVADAGPDLAAVEGEIVTLNASYSHDPDGNIVSYAWKQTSGTAVTLSSDDSMTPHFTTPNLASESESLVFLLVVTDDDGLQSSDSCVVNISWVNTAPTADAGPDQSGYEGETIMLTGVNSYDSDGKIVSTNWTQIEGTPVSLSDASSPNASFIIPEVSLAEENLVFQLNVIDDGGLQASDSCVVVAHPSPLSPVADADLDETVNEGDTVVLNGSNSYDPDGTIVSYTWKQTSGTAVVLQDSTTDQPVFIAPFIEGSTETLVFELLVTDNMGLSAVDSVSIIVCSQSTTPIQTIYDLNAVDNRTGICLMWTPVTGAAYYNIYQGLTSGGPYVQLNQGVQTSSGTYTDTSAKKNINYYYVITSVTDETESLYSNEVSAIHSAKPKK